jgi:hypothetical protein
MVMFREPPRASILTPERFALGAFDAEPGFLDTFGSSLAAGIDESPALGTTLRDIQTPGLAKTPIAGGRGGVMWRDLSAGEVKARGDTLYNSPDEYKASPYFRESVPFEKGMTEARARAIAGHVDLAAVRNYWSAKRPYTAFFGGLAGEIQKAPEYIPTGDHDEPREVPRAYLAKVVGDCLSGIVEDGQYIFVNPTEPLELGDLCSIGFVNSDDGFGKLFLGVKPQPDGTTLWIFGQLRHELVLVVPGDKLNHVHRATAVIDSDGAMLPPARLPADHWFGSVIGHASDPLNPVWRPPESC